MATISALGRTSLREKFGDNYAHELGLRAKRAIREKYGPNGYSFIGKKGGDTVACRYWGKHCGDIAADDERLRILAGPDQLPPKSRSRSSSRRSSSGKLKLEPCLDNVGKIKYSSRRKYFDDNNNDFDNNDYGLYGGSRRMSDRK